MFPHVFRAPLTGGSTQGPGEGRLHQVRRTSTRRDGKTITLKLTTFGDDATTKGLGTDLHPEHEGNWYQLRARICAQSEFSKVVGNREYDVSISGFGVTLRADQCCRSTLPLQELNGVGTSEIDAMVDGWSLILDDAKRAEKCNEIEEAHERGLPLHPLPLRPGLLGMLPEFR